MKVALDVDGCVADFYKAVCKKYNQDYNNPVLFWDTPFIVDNWKEIAADTTMWRGLEVMNEIDFDFHCYLTSVPTHIIEHRQFWIDSNSLPNKPLVVSYDKVAVAEEIGLDILIDDKPANVEAWINSGRIAIQYIPYYSKMPIKSPHYTTNFSDIKPMLKHFKNKHDGEKRIKRV